MLSLSDLEHWFFPLNSFTLQTSTFLHAQCFTLLVLVLVWILCNHFKMWMFPSFISIIFSCYYFSLYVETVMISYKAYFPLKLSELIVETDHITQIIDKFQFIFISCKMGYSTAKWKLVFINSLPIWELYHKYIYGQKEKDFLSFFLGEGFSYLIFIACFIFALTGRYKQYLITSDTQKSQFLNWPALQFTFQNSWLQRADFNGPLAPSCGSLCTLNSYRKNVKIRKIQFFLLVIANYNHSQHLTIKMLIITVQVNTFWFSSFYS